MGHLLLHQGSAALEGHITMGGAFAGVLNHTAGAKEAAGYGGGVPLGCHTQQRTSGSQAGRHSGDAAACVAAASPRSPAEVTA